MGTLVVSINEDFYAIIRELTVERWQEIDVNWSAAYTQRRLGHPQTYKIEHLL